MPVSKLTSKNQITIPKEICNYLHLQAGDKLEFIIKDKNILLRPKNLTVNDLAGILKPKSSTHITVEEMKNAPYKYFNSSNLKSKDH